MSKLFVSKIHFNFQNSAYLYIHDAPPVQNDDYLIAINDNVTKKQTTSFMDDDMANDDPGYINTAKQLSTDDPRYINTQEQCSTKTSVPPE